MLLAGWPDTTVDNEFAFESGLLAGAKLSTAPVYIGYTIHDTFIYQHHINIQKHLTTLNYINYHHNH